MVQNQIYDFFTSVAPLQYPASLAALTLYKASLKLNVCYSSVIITPSPSTKVITLGYILYIYIYLCFKYHIIYIYLPFNTYWPTRQLHNDSLHNKYTSRLHLTPVQFRIIFHFFSEENKCLSVTIHTQYDLISGQYKVTS